ncbi:MAG: SigB/SigF/SigG family RNA polymerase sigma factor [Clostridia bacterium]|nr:SigB/SigF/SigG family RNA polymerase sigma factor [Clostridia bacterium]
MTHTYELIKDAQKGNAFSKETLVKENMKLIFSVAHRFSGKGYETEELCQVGAIGILKAIDKFNVAFGVAFSTYAVPYILGEIKQFLRDNGPIKVSRDIKDLGAKISHVIEETEKTEGRCPGIVEIAKSLGVSPEEVAQAQEAMSPPKSFFAPIKDGTGILSDVLADTKDENLIIDKLDLKSALLSLDKRERYIIVMRYFKDKSQSEIAKKLGISQVQVSRLEKKILNEFRSRLDCIS